MAKRSRQLRTPLVLFGEGPTEELFLGQIRHLYSSELADKAITLGNGEGGSPGNILLALKKQVFSVGAPSTPALVLIDEDKGLDKEAEAVLAEFPEVVVVFSSPQCLEGVLLDLLDNLPAKNQRKSEQLKKRFQDNHLGTRNKIVRTFKRKRADLFTKKLLESKKNSSPCLEEIFRFLGIL